MSTDNRDISSLISGKRRVEQDSSDLVTSNREIEQVEVVQKEPSSLAVQSSPVTTPPAPIVPSAPARPLGRRSLANRSQQLAPRVSEADTRQRQATQQVVSGIEDKLKTIYDRRQQTVDKLSDDLVLLTDPTLIEQDVLLMAAAKRQKMPTNDFSLSNPWEGVQTNGFDVEAAMDNYGQWAEELASDRLAEV